MRNQRRLTVAVFALGACGGGSSTEHELTVRIVGAGSIAGADRSEPSGLDCVLVANQGGTNEIECAQLFRAGAITLVFEPDGAAVTAQFSVTGHGASEPCGDTLASDTCELQ